MALAVQRFGSRPRRFLPLPYRVPKGQEHAGRGELGLGLAFN